MNNITLIGMPGSGKSTIGRILAEELGYTFLDLDAVIERAQGAPLQQVLDKLGVEGFLDLEAQTIRDVHCTRHVLSPGGSAVCRAAGIEHLKSLGPVVYLRVSMRTLRSRIRNMRTRGIAMRRGETLEDVFAERAALYERYADLTVDCPAGQDKARTAQLILQQLSRLGGANRAATGPRTNKQEASMTFDNLGLSAPIRSALRELDYHTPSPIQERAIPPALAGRDILGCAQTGTGKTCAFATPILQRLNEAGRQKKIRALILTPTRELALQIDESFRDYGKNLPLRCTVIFGGVGQGPQVDQLRRGVDILVATPGRLGDLYQQKLLDLSGIEIFVLDEADRMLDMGFIHDVKKILKWLPEKKQTLLFSATMPPEIAALADGLLHDPVHIAVDPVSSPVEVIDQSVYFVDRGNKTKLLTHLMETQDIKNALVFTRTKHGANKVARELVKAGIEAAAIHGNKSQTARQQALHDFKAGAVRCLVATDIAARGLDIEQLSHVFNYNLPDVPETYVHRIGRTGRAGRGGAAVALCEFEEKALLTEIEKLMGKKIPVVQDHPYPMEDFAPPRREKNGRIINAADAEARAAARERARERRAAAAGAKQDGAAAPAPARPPREKGAQPKTAQPKAAQSKPAQSKAAQPKKNTQQPAPAKSPREGVRPGTLFDTGDAMPDVTPRKRPDPLAGEQIMDATARLLAPRKPVLQSERKQRQGGSEHRSDRRRGERTERTHTASGQKRTPKTPAAPPAPAEGAPGQSAARPSARRRTRNTPPPPPAASTRTKDSTEQKTLMKPYYLDN